MLRQELNNIHGQAIQRQIESGHKRKRDSDLYAYQPYGRR